MIGVFTQAGFETATRFADGVVEVRLDLQPTPEAEAAIEARARTAAAEAVRRLLSPRSVAVIGAGRDPELARPPGAPPAPARPASPDRSGR